MIKDWFNDNYFDPFEGEWEGRPNRYTYDPNYSTMTLDDFITENKLGDDKNFRRYAAKHHVSPEWTDGYNINKLNLLLSIYKNIAAREAKLDAKRALESNNPTGIANPADYIGKVTIEKDTDNDGDIDTKITKTKDKDGDEDEDVAVEGSYW